MYLGVRLSMSVQANCKHMDDAKNVINYRIIIIDT